MAIVTLTSDLGNKDQYVAVLKAGLLQADPRVAIVDISNEVMSYNIPQGAYLLRSAYRYFPAGTIHIVAVDAGNSTERCIALRYNSHYFIAPDNGILSLVIDGNAEEIIQLPAPVHQSTFAARDVLLPACAQLLSGKKLAAIGNSLQQIYSKVLLTPPISSNILNASVIHIDKFGNIILNVTRSQFENIVQDRAISISYSRRDVFTEISANYSDVPEGEKLILFNAENHLEIAVNKGNAHALLGIQIDARIQIEIQ